VATTTELGKYSTQNLVNSSVVVEHFLTNSPAQVLVVLLSWRPARTPAVLVRLVTRHWVRFPNVQNVRFAWHWPDYYNNAWLTVSIHSTASRTGWLGYTDTFSTSRISWCQVTWKFGQYAIGDAAGWAMTHPKFWLGVVFSFPGSRFPGAQDSRPFSFPDSRELKRRHSRGKRERVKDNCS